MDTLPRRITYEQCLSIVEAAAEGIAVLDSSGAVQFLNAAAAHMLFGGDHAAAAQADLPALLQMDPGSFSAAGIRQVRIERTVYDVFVLPLTSGSERTGTALLLRDAAAREEVEALTSDFVAIASHELRNPLTALKNALDIVRTGLAGGEPERLQRFVTIAVRNTDRIAGLIDQYLEITRIETGSAPCSFEKVSIAEVVQRMLPELREQAGRAGIALVAALPDDLPPVFADRRRVEQILFNLAGNALKFTPSGGTVTIAAAARSVEDAASGTPDMVCVSVSDTGPGIPPDKRQLIFQKFYRVRRGQESGPQGAGLGLSIVHRLVGLHGGSVFVEDNEPKGSRFCFTLPVFGSERRDPDFRHVFDRQFQRVRSRHEQLTVFMILIKDGAAPGLEHGIKQALQASLHRQQDIVAQRRGGELFAVFCETGKHGARAIIARIKENLGALLARSPAAQNLRIGVGFAVYPDDADNQHDLFHQALAKAQEDAHGTQKDPHC